MTAVFEKHRIQFMYPESWILVENDETDDFIEVSIESPEGSFWSVSIFAENMDREALAQNCAVALEDQYEDFEQFRFEGDIAGFPAVGFDSHFYCLDFLVTAKARAVQVGDRTLNIYCQAESREFDKIEQVFQAITLSLLSSLSEDSH